MNLLITAGPTREPIDPVRFISNRSSGKMGYALAGAAIRRGHAVVLISGPVALPLPEGAEVIKVVTAEDMLKAVRDRLAWCQALIMAAAVSDWRPRHVSVQKLKKNHPPPVLELEPTPDILQSFRPQKDRRLFIGFAAETQHLHEEARRKLAEKGLDLIVANDVSRTDAGFDVDTNQVILISADGWTEELPLMSKDAVADRIIRWAEDQAGDAR